MALRSVQFMLPYAQWKSFQERDAIAQQQLTKILALFKSIRDRFISGLSKSVQTTANNNNLSEYNGSGKILIPSNTNLWLIFLAI